MLGMAKDRSKSRPLGRVESEVDCQQSATTATWMAEARLARTVGSSASFLEAIAIIVQKSSGDRRNQSSWSICGSVIGT